MATMLPALLHTVDYSAPAGYASKQNLVWLGK
eukprot:IDg12009t1